MEQQQTQNKILPRATVISNEDPRTCTYNRYPQNCQKLKWIKSQSSVFVIAKVVSISQGNQSLQKNVEEGQHTFSIVELQDETGTGFLHLENVNQLDQDADRKDKENTLKFFEGAIIDNKFVYLLNAKAHKKTLSLNYWSQVREVLDKRITNEIQRKIDALKQKEEEYKADSSNTEKKQPENLQYVNIGSLTPNLKYVNLKAKIVEVIEFKKLRGYLPDNEKVQQDKEQEQQSIRVTFEDLTGKVYGVFPKKTKLFETLLKVGSVVSLEGAKVSRFAGENSPEENFLYITMYLHKAFGYGWKRTSILVLPQGQDTDLESISIASESTPGVQDNSKKQTPNVSKKIWIVSPEQQKTVE